VVEQHIPHQWRDGEEGATPILAAKLTAIEQTLLRYGIAIDAVEDDLGGVGGGTTGLDITVGTTAERNLLAPTLRRLHLNTETKKPEFGWGSEWRLADGQLINASGGGGGTPGPGTSNAPQNSRATVNPDNSIDVAADPVAGATSYKLYELRSPNGVAGAGALATPSSTRTPSSTGQYGYWWTATVGGVESAASNIAYVSLPYGSTPTPGGGSTGGGQPDTPSEILRLGDEGGHWHIDVGKPSGNTAISMDTLEDGWSEFPYLVPVESNAAVEFRVPMNGGTTPNSEYPRTEMRERKSDGSKASWSGRSGKHILSSTDKVTHLPPNKPEVVIGQVHDGEDDRLQIRVEGDTWRLSVNGTERSTPLLTGYALGTYVSWKISVDGGTVKVFINGAEQFSGNPGWPSTGCYFKKGCYAQTNTSKGNAASEYVSVVTQKNSLVLTHS
jgi:hypothetical protein